jgi:hypothetical protein
VTDTGDGVGDVNNGLVCHSGLIGDGDNRGCPVGGDVVNRFLKARGRSGLKGGAAHEDGSEKSGGKSAEVFDTIFHRVSFF